MKFEEGLKLRIDDVCMKKDLQGLNFLHPPSSLLHPPPGRTSTIQASTIILATRLLHLPDKILDALGIFRAA
jgi:hypothetical protein